MRFSPATEAWFEGTFHEPTPAQTQAWDAIARGDDTLVVAPTGSGKTLAAFLWSIDRLAHAERPAPARRLRVLYVSPLKALAVDVERNLRTPLAGIEAAAARLGGGIARLDVAVRTGDTPQEDRRRMLKTPPDILITTPESLYLMLTSQARDALRAVETVIVDEIHAVAATKRGAHLAVTLERLDELLGRPAQRVGLSATVRPVEEVATFLAGGRPVTVVAPPLEKRWDLRVTVPVEDMTDPEPDAEPGEERSIWPAVHEALTAQIMAHRSTIVFTNSRRLAERLCSRINEVAGTTIARSHHGSVSKEQRAEIEEALKAGRLRCVVATSSLELGIDMGAVDLVCQVESPPSVAHGVQRIGRGGHQVGATSRGIIFPKYRGDLLECAVAVERMRAGQIEEIRFPRNPLDVLAQQIVAMVSADDWTVDALEKTLKRAANFSELPRSALESVLDMLSGRYPSDEFAELRPRLTWDRIGGTLTARPGSKRIAVTNPGTIPDRGLYGVFLAGGDGSRIGELDEEMVYESRVGTVFTLGASNWRIEEITRDRVLVSPAPGEPGVMPFWRGDSLGRPIELGRALGAFTREIAGAREDRAMDRLHGAGLDEHAARNLIAYVREQREATGTVPDDRTIVVERFRDEVGDWRLCVLSPFGGRVHAPWSQAIEARARDRFGADVQSLWSDDGIVLRLVDTDEPPGADQVLFEPDEIEDLVTDQVSRTALFAARFREAAGRALLIPKRRPGQRTPLWQQRQRAAGLMQVASKYGSFPIVLETFRECLRDQFDLPALTELMAQVQGGQVRVVEVETAMPSPFAMSLTLEYVGVFLYEGDSPIAERRAQALSLDRRLLGELLGQDELRDLVDPEALADIELDLQWLTDQRKARDLDSLHDLLRTVGDLAADEIAARSDGDHLGELVAQRRAFAVVIAGEERFIAAEDAARFRDALGTALPRGIPDAFLEPVADPVGDLVGRFARTHGPFVAGDAAARLGLGAAVVEDALTRLAGEHRVVAGAFRPGGSQREWVDAEVLRRLRRRSLAAFRRQIEPVEPRALGRFLPGWQGVGAPRSGVDGVLAAIELLAGAPVPASALESQVLGARVRADDLDVAIDRLLSSGEVVWAGAGGLGPDDGWVTMCAAADAPALLPDPAEVGDDARRVVDALAGRGALFFRQIGEAVGSSDDDALLAAIWECVWAGLVTNDTMAPLRAYTKAKRRARGGTRRAPMPARLGPPAGAGRWSLLPSRTDDRTRRAHVAAQQLLRRHGIVTRGTVVAERVPGGFAAAYQVLKAMEEAGRCRRGYFVEGLGGAQFAATGAVDRLRGHPETGAVVLAAADPANPYGAALPWPDPPSAHRPGRKAGASVVLVDGALALYLEKGGRSMLRFGDTDAALTALVAAVRDGRLPALEVQRVDGNAPTETATEQLREAGFVPTARGMRLRA